MTEPDKEIVDNINKMSQVQIAWFTRFAPSGHIYFDTSLPYNAILKKRFKEVGGMTPEISKQIGW